VDLACLAAGAVLNGYFAYYTYLLVRDSIDFGEVSDGLLGIPLAIPQSAMLAGLVVLTIALVDEFVTVALGGVPSFEDSSDVVLSDPPETASDQA
jgi:ABC-type sulfate transport system permease component